MKLDSLRLYRISVYTVAAFDVPVQYLGQTMTEVVDDSSRAFVTDDYSHAQEIMRCEDTLYKLGYPVSNFIHSLHDRKDRYKLVCETTLRGRGEWVPDGLEKHVFEMHEI